LVFSNIISARSSTNLNIQTLFRERTDTYFKLAVVFLLFLLLSFDQDLGMIYSLIILGHFIWYMTDKDISFPISRGVKNGGFSTLQIFAESMLALGAFLLITSFLTGFAANFFKGTQSIFELLATSTPILKGNIFLTIVGWGVLVPIIETTFFNGQLLEGISTYAEKIYGIKINFGKITGPLIIIVFFVGALFALFHITAKGLNTIPLLITVIFSIISSFLVIRHRETKGAIMIHIIVNTMAVLTSIGWIFS
jgi:hypothetical protein